MKYRFAAIAILGMLITTGCGHDEISDNASEMSADSKTAEVSVTEEISDNSAEETSEKDGISTADDVSEIPDGAAYKCTEYMVINDTPTLSSISYCDAHGNEIRSFSYSLDEIDFVFDLEHEYDSEGRLVSTRQKNESFNEYVDSDESFCEFEYYENGDMKKMSLYNGDETTTIEFVYEYDDDGRAVVVDEYWNGSDELSSRTYKTYDENGNVIKESGDIKGKLESETLYQYDEKGRVVQKEISMSSFSSYWEYEYEDYI